MGHPFRTLELSGMELVHADETALLDHLFAELGRGRGGFLVTANLDILRRHAKDAVARGLYDAADVRVADGMPLVWASRIAGDPLPGRVAGASLVPILAERAAREGRTLYLLGGDEGVAAEARTVLEGRHPGLRVVGTSSPRVGNPPTAAELEPILAELRALAPDLVLVALGSPKQEHVCLAVRSALPAAWTIGVGASLSFLTGHMTRAPLLLQKLGLEWAHRLAHEPTRLARRYLVDDLPFGILLGLEALGKRFSRRP